MTKVLKYPKTENVFKRDPDTHRLIEDELRWEEVGLISEWVVTEKIDGTNIRVSLVDSPENDEWQVLIQGRGDNAQIPGPLKTKLKEMFPLSLLMGVCEGAEPYEFTLHGEGYGAGIQKGGIGYNPGPNFRVFDVRVGDKWLSMDNIEDIAFKLDIDTAPILSRGQPIDAIVEYVKSDPVSWASIAEGDGEKKQEGIVATTDPQLYTWWGDRLKFKLKGKDLVLDGAG